MQILPRMEKIREHIVKSLHNLGIKKDFTHEISEMIENKIINDSMPLRGAYQAFLLHMSSTHPMYMRILKREYLFDLIFSLPKSKNGADPFLSNLKPIKDQFEYFYIEENTIDFTVCVKLHANIYDIHHETAEYLRPYRLLQSVLQEKFTDAKFNEIIFPYKQQPDIRKTYALFIEHLKSLDLPLSIVLDDILFENTNICNVYHAFIYLEDTCKWPREQYALDCAKTAFYCQLYLKSNYRVAIDKDFCVFEFDNVFFKVKILIKKDLNVKTQISLALNSVINSQSTHFHRKVKMVKTIFSNLGFYPLIFDDFLIDCISLIIGHKILSDAKFIHDFLSSDFELENKILNLETIKCENEYVCLGKFANFKIVWKDLTYSVTLPNKQYISEIKDKFRDIVAYKDTHFDRNLNIMEIDILMPKFEECTFILAKELIDSSFEEIIGAITSSSDLLQLEDKCFNEHQLLHQAKLYYSPSLNVLIVKENDDFDKHFIANLLITETSFSFIKFC